MLRIPKRAAAGLAVVGITILTSCANDDGYDQSALQPENRVAESYASALNVDLDAMERRPTGLHVQDVVVGDGARADSGDVVIVHYTGWLPQGKPFDSSVDRGEPLEVAIGYGRVIAGWDQGIVGMRIGGQRRLVIPPGLGYGEQGMGPIPGNSTLVFDVELLEVEDRS